MHVVEIFSFLDNSTFLWLKTYEVQQALGNILAASIMSPSDPLLLIFTPLCSPLPY